MNIESLREYCISKPCVEECFPFDESTLVFKVLGKMFLLTDLVSEFSISVKCDPEKAIDLRERFSFQGTPIILKFRETPEGKK